MDKNLIDFQAIILASGKGKRMGGETPKVIKVLLEKPIIEWTLELLMTLKPKNIVVTISHQKDLVKKALRKYENEVIFCEETEPMGTGHSVKNALPVLPKIGNLPLLVIFGDDSALYKKTTLENLLKSHIANNNKMTVLTFISNNKSKIGGLKRDNKGQLAGVWSLAEIETKKDNENEILCGALVFDRTWIEENINKLIPNQTNGEYPLPGLIKIAYDQQCLVGSQTLNDLNEWNSVNTPEEFEETVRKKMFLLNNNNANN